MNLFKRKYILKNSRILNRKFKMITRPSRLNNKNLNEKKMLIVNKEMATTSLHISKSSN